MEEEKKFKEKFFKFIPKPHPNYKVWYLSPSSKNQTQDCYIPKREPWDYKFHEAQKSDFCIVHQHKAHGDPVHGLHKTLLKNKNVLEFKTKAFKNLDSGKSQDLYIAELGYHQPPEGKNNLVYPLPNEKVHLFDLFNMISMANTPNSVYIQDNSAFFTNVINMEFIAIPPNSNTYMVKQFPSYNAALELRKIHSFHSLGMNGTLYLQFHKHHTLEIPFSSEDVITVLSGFLEKDSPDKKQTSGPLLMNLKVSSIDGDSISRYGFKPNSGIILTQEMVTGPVGTNIQIADQ